MALAVFQRMVITNEKKIEYLSAYTSEADALGHVLLGVS